MSNIDTLVNPKASTKDLKTLKSNNGINPKDNNVKYPTATASTSCSKFINPKTGLRNRSPKTNSPMANTTPMIKY